MMPLITVAKTLGRLNPQVESRTRNRNLSLQDRISQTVDLHVGRSNLRGSNYRNTWPFQSQSCG